MPVRWWLAAQLCGLEKQILFCSKHKGFKFSVLEWKLSLLKRLKKIIKTKSIPLWIFNNDPQSLSFICLSFCHLTIHLLPDSKPWPLLFQLTFPIPFQIQMMYLKTSSFPGKKRCPYYLLLLLILTYLCIYLLVPHPEESCI